MTLDEIKAALDQGKTVHWSNSRYTVIKDIHEYLIVCDIGTRKEHAIGLSGRDGVTMNGKPEDFYIGEQ